MNEFPRSSYPLPVVSPSSRPDEGDFISVAFNVAWLPYVLGALQQLWLPTTWQGSEDDVNETILSAMTLSALFGDALGDGNMYVGQIVMLATANYPAGVLACDGSNYTKAAYPELYDALDTSLHTDSTHFNVPDLRGRVPVGGGTGSGLTTRVFNDAGGEETHQLSTAELAQHFHAVKEGGASGGSTFYKGTTTAGVTNDQNGGGNMVQTQNAGSNTAHNNMQPFRVVKFGIVAKV